MVSERDISFDVDGQKVIGTLALPAGVLHPPVVLMCHGFTGQRHEMPIIGTEEGVFSRAARLLAEAGFASLRIDFRGSGESGGLWEDTTYSSQIKDGIAAIDWLKTSAEVDQHRVSILGWSQGGLVAAHVAAARPEVKCTILWAPLTNPMAAFVGGMGIERFSRLLALPADQTFKLPLGWGGETTLKATYLYDVAMTDTVGAAASYPGPLMVVSCLKDEAIRPQPQTSAILLKYHKGPQVLHEVETDHSFGASVGPNIIDQQMVPLTLDWLKRWG